MYVQLDRIEDGKWAVLLPYPDGGRALDVARERLPEDASPGDVFRLDPAGGLERDASRTQGARAESAALHGELLRSEPPGSGRESRDGTGTGTERSGTERQ